MLYVLLSLLPPLRMQFLMFFVGAFCFMFVEVYSCPVVTKLNQSSLCNCRPTGEILCSGLDAVPAFKRDATVYTTLYMSGQAIRSVKSDAFSKIKVKKLILNDNPIGKGLHERSFTGLGAELLELQLGACQLTSLPRMLFANMTSLRSLHLWDNRLELLPRGLFRSIPALRELLLWGNRLSQLDKQSFVGLRNLRRLDLDRNGLRSIDKDTFRRVPKLEALHLGENSLEHIQLINFSHMTHLKVLNLDAVGVRSLQPNLFAKLPALLSLSLHDNHIESVHQMALAGLHSLQTLRLQRNNMSELPLGLFGSLRRLQSLDFSHNLIVHLPANLLSNCTSLRHLWLDDNPLPTLTRCSLPSHVQSLKTLSLSGNKITCDCRMKWASRMRGDDVVWGACSELDSPQLMHAIASKRVYQRESCTQAKMKAMGATCKKPGRNTFYL